MTPTWRERREDLEARGVTSMDLLETIRAATASGRVEAREAEVGRLLAAAEEEEGYQTGGGGLAAALDCCGAGGPHGAGGPDGCSARIPLLVSIPRHRAMVGGAWDAAVRTRAWDAIYGAVVDMEEGEKDLILANSEIADDPDDLLSHDPLGWVVIDPPEGLEPEWWAGLEPWLAALARRVVLESEAPGHAPGPLGRGLEKIEIRFSGEAANALAMACGVERARRAVIEARWVCSDALHAEQAERKELVDRAVELIRAAESSCAYLPWESVPRDELVECDELLRRLEAQSSTPPTVV